LGAKKILMDSGTTRHNSLVTTPTSGKFFEGINTNYMDTGWNLLPKKAYLNQNNANFFNNEVEVWPEKENKNLLYHWTSSTEITIHLSRKGF